MKAKRKLMADMKAIFKDGIWIPKKIPHIFGRAMQNSLIAAMDILGFKEIVKDNASISLMRILCLSLENAMRAARGQGSYSRYFPRTKKTSIRQIRNSQKRIETFLFSDTLIMICPNIIQSDPYASFGFIEAVCGAVEALFEYGYPVKAFIDYGDCFRSEKENFIIGEPFVSAIVEADKLSFSGLCISDRAKEIACVNPVVAHRWGIDTIPVPVKGEVPVENRNCIDWMRTAYDRSFSVNQVHRFVMDGFTKNGKKVATKRAKELLKNTERVIKDMAKAQRKVIEK